MARANEVISKFFPGVDTRHFADRRSLNFPVSYVLLANRFFDLSLAPHSVVKRRPQLPPPTKSNMHPKIGQYYVEGALTTHEILKDGKLTWCLPPDLWEKSNALSRQCGLQQHGFLAREAIGWMSRLDGPQWIRIPEVHIMTMFFFAECSISDGRCMRDAPDMHISAKVVGAPSRLEPGIEIVGSAVWADYFKFIGGRARTWMTVSAMLAQ